MPSRRRDTLTLNVESSSKTNRYAIKPYRGDLVPKDLNVTREWDPSVGINIKSRKNHSQTTHQKGKASQEVKYLTVTRDSKFLWNKPMEEILH